MWKTFLKQKKKWIVFIILLILLEIGIYILLPRIDSICFRRKVGTLNEWREMCNREEAYFLNYDVPDSGLYITGIRGLTDWGMMVRIYSRKNMTLETPQEISGEYKTWDFYLTCKGEEHGNFPYRDNLEMLVGKKQFAYPVTTYLAAPAKIGEDGTITLLYHSGEDYEQEKEVRIYVKCEKVTE